MQSPNQIKPTIAELEAILNDPEQKEIEILPDGSIHAVPKGTKNDADYKPLTFKQAMQEYF